MLAVVVSRADSASEHIGERLLEIAEWTAHEDPNRPEAEGGGTYYRSDGVELRTFERLHLRLEGVAEAFDDPDLLVFASRHSGETGALLTAHSTGNFGPAEYGGTDRSLAAAAPNALKRIREAFEEYAPAEFAVGIECTHHGPSEVGCRSLFAELGSGEAQWADPEGAEAVARSILELRGVAPRRDRAVVGFGGGHYAPRFDRVLRETDWAIGHVAADWCLEEMGDPKRARDVIDEAFERSGARRALLDDECGELAAVVDDLGYEIVSETWLRETSGVPPQLVERLESTLSRVDDGLRFGAKATEHETDPAIAALPADLLAEANGVDRAAVREAVDGIAVAYETKEGASVVDGRVALADGRDRAEIVEALADVLGAKYDRVETRADVVIANRESFDPELARDAGVSEGPAFGELSAGRAVEIDGETIEPSDVRSARERRFPR